MPFGWLWQSGETTPTIDSLGGGNYSATVTDANGCTGDIDFTISPPVAIDVNIATIDPLCFGGNGVATASATGGTGSFSYLWDNGATTANTMLPEGPHSVTATDANGCTAIGTAVLTAPPALVVTATAHPPMLCHGASNGSITVSTTGGTAPYGWGGPLENLPAGSYTVTVTDSHGCTATASATLAELPEITATGTVMDASSPTASDGSVSIASVTGGMGSGYTFLWSNNATTQNLSGVPTGDYTVTVKDPQGCTGVFSFHVDFETAAGEAKANPFGAAIVPNPSGSSDAKLVVGKAKPGLRYSVLDALGREIIAEQKLTTEAQALPLRPRPGSYFVVLRDGDAKVVLKWVVVE